MYGGGSFQYGGMHRVNPLQRSFFGMRKQAFTLAKQGSKERGSLSSDWPIESPLLRSELQKLLLKILPCLFFADAPEPKDLCLWTEEVSFPGIGAEEEHLILFPQRVRRLSRSYHIGSMHAAIMERNCFPYLLPSWLIPMILLRLLQGSP